MPMRGHSILDWSVGPVGPGALDRSVGQSFRSHVCRKRRTHSTTYYVYYSTIVVSTAL